MDSLFTKLSNADAALFYNKDFVDYIEMNLADLKKASKDNAPIFELTETQRARGKNNFNLICNMAGIPYHLHWLTMRINNMTSMSEYQPSMDDIYMLDMDALATLKLKFVEAQSIT